MLSKEFKDLVEHLKIFRMRKTGLGEGWMIRYLSSFLSFRQSFQYQSRNQYRQHAIGGHSSYWLLEIEMEVFMDWEKLGKTKNQKEGS